MGINIKSGSLNITPPPSCSPQSQAEELIRSISGPVYDPLESGFDPCPADGGSSLAQQMVRWAAGQRAAADAGTAAGVAAGSAINSSSGLPFPVPARVLQALGGGVQDVVAAVQDFRDHRTREGALKVIDLAHKLPGMAEPLVGLVAGKMDLSSVPGGEGPLLQSLLKDPAVVGALASDSNTARVVRDLWPDPQGHQNIGDAMLAFSESPELLAAVWPHLQNDRGALGSKLRDCGFDQLPAADFPAGVRALPDLYQAYLANRAGDQRQAIAHVRAADSKAPQFTEDLIRLFAHSPAFGRSGLGSSPAGALLQQASNHPDEIGGLLDTSQSALNASDAWDHGDPIGFVGNTVMTVANGGVTALMGAVNGIMDVFS